MVLFPSNPGNVLWVFRFVWVALPCLYACRKRCRE